MMRSKLVIANWKMNGSRQFLAEMAESLRQEATTGFGSTDKVVLCPPSVYLSALAGELETVDIELGAQNLSEHSSGAYTGEISAEMLGDVGCSWVLVGHSERRALNGETSGLVALKARMALSAGLNAVVCVGETLADRQSANTENVVAEQLAPVLSIDSLQDFSSQLVIAYEPVWAIGTGETASPEQAQEVHEFIRGQLGEKLSSVSVLYGGSVKPENAAELFGQPDIDGGLIGGASLKAEDFVNICRAMPA